MQWLLKKERSACVTCSKVHLIVYLTQQNNTQKARGLQVPSKSVDVQAKALLARMRTVYTLTLPHSI